MSPGEAAADVTSGSGSSTVHHSDTKWFAISTRRAFEKAAEGNLDYDDFQIVDVRNHKTTRRRKRRKTMDLRTRVGNYH